VRKSGVKCFIKRESYATYKNPRGIYSRDDVFKCFCGPLFKAIEEEVFKLDNFIKKIPIEERAEYLSNRFGPTVVDPNREGECERIMTTDYTTYEASFEPAIMDAVEFELYTYMLSLFPGSQLFIKKLKKSLMGKNSLKFGVRFLCSVLAKRMSGEMNTSLGNGFSNLVVFFFNCEEQKCKFADCVVEGDDLLGRYVGVKFNESTYERLGFIIKIKYLCKINVASFCGQIFDNETKTVIADPLKVIMNFGWADQQYVSAGANKRMKLLRAKAMSLLALYPGCPILQSIGVCFERLTRGYKYDLRVLDHWFIINSNIRWNRVVHNKLRVVSPSSRYLMEEVFGFDINEQLELEHYFDNLGKVEPLFHPAMERHIHPIHRDYFSKFVRRLDEGVGIPYYFSSSGGELRFRAIIDIVNASKEKTQG